MGTRLRFKFKDRWWAATVRELGGDDGRLRVGFDGWPSRHDEFVDKGSDHIYLHESFHAEYVAPPIPKRYQRPAPVDADGNALPVTPRPPRPKVFDPEKERMKRALRPPLPYNPEKERLKRLLRGQYAPPIEQSAFDQPSSDAGNQQPHAQAEPPPFSEARIARDATAATAVSGRAAAGNERQLESEQSKPNPAPPPPGPPPQVLAWQEMPGGVDGVRAFRSTSTGEVCKGPPPSGWVEILADGGAHYYWNVESKATQWQKPG